MEDTLLTTLNHCDKASKPSPLLPEYHAITCKKASQSYQLHEFTRFNGREFICNAYKILLNREPDLEGLQFYLFKLEQGESKANILHALQTSPEGSSYKIHIKGLALNLRAIAWQDIPIIGKAVRLLHSCNQLRYLFRLQEWQREMVQQTYSTLHEYNQFVAQQNHQFQKKIANDLNELNKKLMVHNQIIENLQMLSTTVQENLATLNEINKIAHSTIEKTPGWSDFYANFETQFRGSKEVIKERIQIYLPELIQLPFISHNVLDIGSGRGEWLELLRENNIHGVGVEINETFVKDCRAQKLEVECCDMFDFFKDQKEHMYSAITAFHIIEHLPLVNLLQMLDECLRILKPGGLLLLETPNPQNIVVGSHSFYIDPTHRKPLPPALMQFMVTQRGFSSARILPVNPFPIERMINEDTEVAKRINELFYGAQDYAIIAYKNYEHESTAVPVSTRP